MKRPLLSHGSAPKPGPKEESSVDWDALEAAAKTLRTCRVVKKEGEKLGLRLLNYSGPNFAGAHIIKVSEGSAGEVAGLIEGDNIVEINGQPIINMWHEEVIGLLVKSGNEFDVLVCREDTAPVAGPADPRASFF
jgi:membrane-associated protease RseP (regulator of RpoE activity)